MTRLLAVFTVLATATAFTSSPSIHSSSTRLCAELDPRQSRSMNAMDNNRNAPSWTQANAPVPQSSEPSSSGGGVPADPPKRENLWTNYQDKPRGERTGLSKLL